ncbi:MAG: DUF3575 domain-containing protein [Cytophagales bacterium]|nr:MAG: DUF3575 domain-containing protein [Cytophagales bacterium]
MKKNVFFTIALFAIYSLSNHSFAQSEKKNIIKVNLLSPIIRTGSFFYERVITPKSSGQLGFYYTGWALDGTKLRGIGITPEFRYYVSESKQAPQGFFVAPFLRYQRLELSTDATTAKGVLSTLGVGLAIGGQWIFSDVISLDIFGGPTVNTRNFKASANGVTESDFTLTGLGTFGFRFGVTVGIAF